ncbi:MAG TPA: TetR/AcrR family transcriptional regulator [Rhodopseudomonas sp.]|uniref:TetR/AcrR family transcriptional regulator n=1 Tax=Rhodopseudomonas sp. TaxID=1078 RepID=UPI002ED7B656
MVAIPGPAHGPHSEDDCTKRRQILEGARAVFLELGFDGASMGEIAKAAGVSKGTLYVYFADKNSLFGAIVEQESRELGILAFDFDLDGEVGIALPKFGQAYIRLLCNPRGGSAIRTVMAIAERMPEIGRGYYQRVIATTVGRLGAYLKTQVEAGVLTIDDCDFAASQFMMCCQASLFLPFIFQATPAPSPEQIAKVVDSATRMFLAAYLAAPGADYSSS